MLARGVVPVDRPRPSDAGPFLSRSIVAGVPAGLAAALWAVLVGSATGLAWWVPVALFRTRMAGLSRTPVVAHSLAGAVAAGAVWLMLLGMAFGGLWGLLAGTVGRAWPRGASAILGFVYGAILFILAATAHTVLLPPTLTAELPGWARLCACGVLGAVIGAYAPTELV